MPLAYVFDPGKSIVHLSHSQLVRLFNRTKADPKVRCITSRDNRLNRRGIKIPSYI